VGLTKEPLWHLILTCMMWKSINSSSWGTWLCEMTLVQVLCIAIVYYLIYYYFNNMLGHVEW